jgi:hypothetical protein
MMLALRTGRYLELLPDSVTQHALASEEEIAAHGQALKDLGQPKAIVFPHFGQGERVEPVPAWDRFVGLELDPAKVQTAKQMDLEPIAAGELKTQYTHRLGGVQQGQADLFGEFTAGTGIQALTRLPPTARCGDLASAEPAFLADQQHAVGAHAKD